MADFGQTYGHISGRKFHEGGASMDKVLEIASISQFKEDYLAVLSKLEHGPVVLASYQKPRAVLVSPEMWNDIVARLQERDDLILQIRLAEIGGLQAHGGVIDETQTRSPDPQIDIQQAVETLRAMEPESVQAALVRLREDSAFSSAIEAAAGRVAGSAKPNETLTGPAQAE